MGAGAAGLSAAIFLARARRRVVVFDGGPKRIDAVRHIHELLGHDGMTPAEFLERGQHEIQRHGGQIRRERVLDVEPSDGGHFHVRSEQGVVDARAIIFATGLIDVVPSVPGLQEIWGEDAQVCPCFGGYEDRDKRLVAFGIGERLAQSAKFLTAWSRSVTAVTTFDFDSRTRERLQHLGVEIVSDDVAALDLDAGRLTGVVTAQGRRIPCDAVYASTPLRAASDLPSRLCEVDADGFATVDANGHTSRPGVWAIGNASDPIGHLAHALADGTRVGPWVNDFLIESDLARASKL
ncbi:NAD(P)/FAD-dependent oxidoreductase [Saccharopolyspora sp. 5N708]